MLSKHEKVGVDMARTLHPSVVPGGTNDVGCFDYQVKKKRLTAENTGKRFVECL